MTETATEPTVAGDWLSDVRDAISTAEAARLAQVTTDTLRAWSSKFPDFPRPMKTNSRIWLWSRAEIVAWLKAHRQDAARAPQPSA